MLKDDIRNLLHTQEDNFSVLLMRLYQKADMVNKAKIRRGWPNLAAVVDAWQAGPDTDEQGWDHVPDLPYDEVTHIAFQVGDTHYPPWDIRPIAHASELLQAAKALLADCEEPYGPEERDLLAVIQKIEAPSDEAEA